MNIITSWYQGSFYVKFQHWCILSFFRPLSEEEVKVKTPAAISCNELRREVTAFQNMGNKQIDKTFMFDKV